MPPRPLWHTPAPLKKLSFQCALTRVLLQAPVGSAISPRWGKSALFCSPLFPRVRIREVEKSPINQVSRREDAAFCHSNSQNLCVWFASAVFWEFWNSCTCQVTCQTSPTPLNVERLHQVHAFPPWKDTNAALQARKGVFVCFVTRNGKSRETPAEVTFTG